MRTKDDKIIIKQVLKGDVAAFSVLIDRYRHMVYTLAFQITKNKSDAEEVAQDAFLKAFQALASFEGRASFSTWIYQITFHQAISKIRQNKKHNLSYKENISNENSPLTDDNITGQLLEREDRKRFLNEALSRLKGEESFILILYYYEDLNIEEIAKITGYSATNVKVRLFRARLKLHNELKILLKLETNSLL
ncbi:RNA polymerase sigma factor [Thermophagus xiamenensis]|jgi:RNA polymerase sigma-70 factor (ECF subfamily)|nr:RNA polymerase sigma factor [Thermophagus xiamenensis]